MTKSAYDGRYAGKKKEEWADETVAKEAEKTPADEAVENMKEAV